MRRVVVAVLVFASACSSDGSGMPADPPTVTVTASPSVSLDARARAACDAAAKDAWLFAVEEAKLSMVRELQDVALREEQLGNHELVKAWCAEHYQG